MKNNSTVRWPNQALAVSASGRQGRFASALRPERSEAREHAVDVSARCHDDCDEGFLAFENDVTANRNGSKCDGMRFSNHTNGDEKCSVWRALVILGVVALYSTTAWAADPILPDRQLTPGAVLTTDTARVCEKGYSKTVRHTSGKLKARIYAEYGLNRRSGHYEIDHLIPLSVGGADVAANLWPESYDTSPWNAYVKDRLELKLHKLVCDGSLDIAEAQQAFTGNWIESYKRFCPTEADCPAYRERRDGE